MTRLLLILGFLTLLLTPAAAQFKKGTWMIGGGVSGNYTTDKSRSGGRTTKNYTDYSILLSPRVGYFVLNNFAVGLIANLSTEVTKYASSSDKIVTNGATAGPFARYYIHGFFAHGQFDFGNLTYQDVGVNGSKETTHTSSWKAGIGYAWLINEHIAVEPLLTYGSVYNNPNISSYPEKYSTPGLTFELAFQVYLNRK